MRTLTLLTSAFFLAAPAVLFSAPAAADPAAEAQDDGPIARLAVKTCNTLDAVGIAVSDNPEDPTGPASGAAVWGCYFSAFFGMAFAPISPGIATGCGTALAGVIGAYMGGRSVLSVALWSLPGVAAGIGFTVLGALVALAMGAAYLSFGFILSTPPIAIPLFALILFVSLASMTAGPLALAGIIYAEDSETAVVPERPPEPSTVSMVRY